MSWRRVPFTLRRQRDWWTPRPGSHPRTRALTIPRRHPVTRRLTSERRVRPERIERSPRRWQRRVLPFDQGRKWTPLGFEPRPSVMPRRCSSVELGAQVWRSGFEPLSLRLFRTPDSRAILPPQWTPRGFEPRSSSLQGRRSSRTELRAQMRIGFAGARSPVNQNKPTCPAEPLTGNPLH